MHLSAGQMADLQLIVSQSSGASGQDSWIFNLRSGDIMAKKTHVIMILDGYGLNPDHNHNAVWLANTPVMDKLEAEYPFVQGYASGLAVGLPDGQMGNSEVGHTNMGAGRVVYQELTRISKAIDDGDFFENEELLAAINNAKEHDSSLHFMGLVSPGGVHSHTDHLYGLLEMAKRNGLKKVYVHCFMDGRDTPPDSGKGYIKDLMDKMDEIGVGEIATVSGRYYAMDRDNRWERVVVAYNALVKGEGDTAACPLCGMQASYDKGVVDEFVVPFVVQKDGKPVATIKENDSIVFFNFRPDRAREITRCFCDDEFDHFDRGPRIKTTYVCFTDYDVTIGNKLVAFKKQELDNVFGKWISDNGMTQLRTAETEKYAHVTFFFNGGVEEPFEGEDRLLVPSPKVATYDLQPEMSAPQVCDGLVDAIKSGKYDVIIINFANGDMVGHTGVESAAIKAVECVDVCVGRAVEAIKEVGGIMFICADHGNCDMMVDPATGEPFTAHTTNPVPFILVNADPKYGLAEGGRLCDIVPTMIELMGKEVPKEMTGHSLLIER